MSGQNAAFKKWYETHKQEFSEKRKQRYASDPEYRRKAVERVREYRQRKREAFAIPSEYTHTVFSTAEALGIKSFVLHRWKVKGYYPPPFHAKGRFYFTDAQVKLLVPLAVFFKKYSSARHLDDVAAKRLSEIISLIFTNW